MALVIQAMTSAECSMGLRSFLQDEPLNANHLKSDRSRMCEELEIKSLMESAHEYETNKKPKTSVDYGPHEGSSSTSSSSVCSTNGVRPIRKSSNESRVIPSTVQSKVSQKPSRTPSTASTSISSNGTVRQNKHDKARPEHTEPTVLVTTHRRSSQHILNPPSSFSNEGLIETSLSRRRRDSQDSQLADAEVCQTLRNHRCRTTSQEMVDEDVLLDEDCGANEDFGNNDAGSGIHSRRRVLPETPSPETVRGFKMCAPNKTQVLNYIATTKLLCIRRAGTELQVTDTTGFPLLDVWQKTSCFSSTWVLESYGRTVLLLTDSGRSWKPWNFNQPMSNFLEVTDEDDEIVGYFQVDEPFVVQNKDHTPIARFMGYESGDGRTVLFQCVLECSGEEVGRLEPRKAQLSQLRFTQLAISFQLKLLVLAAAIRIAALPQPAGCLMNNQRVTKRNKKGVCCSIV